MCILTMHKMAQFFENSFKEEEPTAAIYTRDITHKDKEFRY